MLTQNQVLNTNRQNGVGLIEVLVALLVLTIGVLGMVALQSRALQLNQESVYTSHALMLAYEMTDRMRANRNVANAYLVDYGTDVAAGTDCETDTCDEDDMADFDTNRWKASIVQNLPEGDGQITVDNSGNRPFYTISVRFSDRRIDQALDGGTGGESIREVHVRTEI